MRNLLLIGLIALGFATAFAQQANEENDAGTTPQMQQMQARMQQMREQMERIRATEDPEERRRRMQAHMQSMHEGMAMMGDMMSRPMAQGRMRECEQGDTACTMDRMQMQQQMMGQRMGMMHQMMMQMMEQMMERQEQGDDAAETAGDAAVSHDAQH